MRHRLPYHVCIFLIAAPLAHGLHIIKEIGSVDASLTRRRAMSRAKDLIIELQYTHSSTTVDFVDSLTPLVEGWHGVVYSRGRGFSRTRLLNTTGYGVAQ